MHWQEELVVFSFMLKVLGAVLLSVVIAVTVLRLRAYSPQDLEIAAVDCAADAPVWAVGTPLKVMSYNVQYMASKHYIFFYDIDLEDQQRVEAVGLAGKAIADKPSKEHVLWTLDEVATLIANEAPDVVMLQEINGGNDGRTYYIDQASELLRRLPDGVYACQSHAPYWQAEYILHPHVMAPVDMQLSTLSRYRITKSVRHQLPRKARNFLVRPFNFQRALLESHIATDKGGTIAMINTHFDAWGAGTGVMERQVEKTLELLRSLDDERVPWVFGGDLNLLPPDNNRQRARIAKARTGEFDPQPRIAPLYERYRAIPSLANVMSVDPVPWYTHFPNDPTVNGPDRTIDYLFYSDQWALRDAYVVQKEALALSDHLPVMGVYSLPPSMPQ